MKSSILRIVFLVGLVALAPVVRAQIVTTINFIGTNPVYDDKGALVSATVQAMFKQTGTLDGKTVEVTPAPNISWDGTDKKRTIEVDGITLTYDQVTRAAGLIAEKELGAGSGTQRKAAIDKVAADKAAADAAAAAAAKP